jgi:hypothetical protein
MRGCRVKDQSDATGSRATLIVHLEREAIENISQVTSGALPV